MNWISLIVTFNTEYPEAGQQCICARNVKQMIRLSNRWE